ncbi:arsenate reductase/protein-tyrosine-phosphatase family protein [Micrococcus endophyticus]|uniref:arsenate-mycothiol transferase ArsC n=1 Tax=Micrococcus endophyticus TaxID=455343 RepID=UPI0034CE238B
MSQDRRAPIRNPFLEPGASVPSAPPRRADADPEDRLAEFRLGPAFGGRLAQPRRPQGFGGPTAPGEGTTTTGQDAAAADPEPVGVAPERADVAPEPVRVPAEAVDVAAEPVEAAPVPVGMAVATVPAEPMTDRAADDEEAPAPAPLPTVRVLAVCTGNICRSAFVHHTLQSQLNALLGERGTAVVTSAGTGPNQALTVPEPLLGHSPSRRVRAALREHRPRQLTAAVLRDQDLVLTATDEHLEEVLREDPGAVRRTFTVLGVGTLLGEHGEEVAAAVPAGAGVAALVDALADLRVRLISRGEEPDADLADPFRGPDEGYAQMAETAGPIVELLAWEIARALDGDLVEDEEPAQA